MTNTQVSDELSRKGIRFNLLSKGSRELSDLETAFEEMVKLNRVAEIDWSTAKNVSSFSSENYAELFKMAEKHISEVFLEDLTASTISVIPFDGNNPTIVLPVDEAIKAVEIFLELEPLWVVSFSKKWCFEWRRSSNITSGYFF